MAANLSLSLEEIKKKITYGLFNACMPIIPINTVKHINVLYFNIKSGSFIYEHSQFLFLKRSKIVETLLLKLGRSFSGPFSERRRLENRL